MLTFILNNCTAILLLILVFGFVPLPGSRAIERWNHQILRKRAIQTDFRSDISAFERKEGWPMLGSIISEPCFDQKLLSVYQNSTVSMLLSGIRPSMARGAESSTQVAINVTNAVLDCTIFATKELDHPRMEHADKDDSTASTTLRDGLQHCTDGLSAADTDIILFRDIITTNITVKVDQLHGILSEKHYRFGSSLIKPQDSILILKAVTARILEDILQVEENLAAALKNVTVTRDTFAEVYGALDAESDPAPSLEKAKDHLCSYAVKCEMLPDLLAKEARLKKS